MSYIPSDAKWYLADMVESITVGLRKKVTVHINTVLVRADSPQEAYTRAMELGRQGHLRYRNINGEEVKIRFLGLRNLNVIHDELEHGAELTYRRMTMHSPQRAKALVRRKSDLGVFAPLEQPIGPNFVEADLQRKLEARFGTTQFRRRKKTGSTSSSN